MTDSVDELRARIRAENDQSLARAGRVFAWLLFWAGALILAWSFFFDVGATIIGEPGVANLDLLFTRLMICIAGVGLMITGAVFIAGRRQA